eukprot:TRINITY_DN2303_c0_g1_i1.p1 TRINITY_DN2303_c0_g1~~TRINITY_DN2303_c0_g1_i1.p1  ORF type:complete len:135 (-),score=50.07 TRINITY_DN2303_c0_g1_i1:11-415(-)
MRVIYFFFFLMIRRPPRSTLSSSSAASDVYKRQVWWDVLSVPVEVRLNASRVPLMVISHPMWAQVDVRVDDPLPLSSATTLLGMSHMGESRVLGADTSIIPVSYTHLRAHETPEHLVCRLLLEKKKKTKKGKKY